MDEWDNLATTALMPSVMAVMNLAILPRIAHTRFLPQESHAIFADLTQGSDTPATQGTDHTPIMALDIGDISAVFYSPTLVTITTEAAVLEGTTHALLPHAPILHYPDPSKCYIVYTDLSVDTCAVHCLKNMMVKNLQLHSCHTFTDTQWK